MALKSPLVSPLRSRVGGGSGSSISSIYHTALYDSNNGGSTTQVTDSGGATLPALVFAASTAAPTYLAAPGATPYVYLPGVAGNYLSIPDHARLDIVGDLEFVARVGLNSWTALGQSLLSKLGGAGGRSYIFQDHSGVAGRMQMRGSTDGTAVGLDRASTVAVGFSAGQIGWVKTTFDADNGAAGHTVTFYADADQASEPAGTILGTAVVTAGTFALFSGGRNVDIGSDSGGTSALAAGKFVRAILRNGIGGTTALDFDAASTSQTGMTDSAGNVITMNYGTAGLVAAVKSQAANDVAAGVLADGSNDYATGPVGAIPALTAADACTLFTVTRPRATMTTDMTFLSTRNGAGAGVTLRMASATTVVADVSDGTSTATTPAVTITPGTRYVLGVVVPTSGGAYCFANNTLGSTVARTGNTETGGALTVFANSTPANFCRTHSRVPYAAIPRAVTAGELALLVTQYGGGA